MIKMDKLLVLFEQLGFKQQKTYIQSGNVVFQATHTPHEVLERQIAEKISEVFAFEVPVMVKEKEEWLAIAQNNPFVNERNEDPTKLHVTFLSGIPDATRIDKIKQAQYGVDEFIVSGKVIYLYCPDSYGNTKLSNNFFESKLKVTATTRNWKTVNELMAIAESQSQ